MTTNQTTKSTASPLRMLKKISRATVFGDKADVQEIVLADREKLHDLYAVEGRATHIERIKGRFKDGERSEEERQDWKFIGKFRAVNLVTGELFAAPVCYLPQFAANIVAGEMGGEGDEAIFGFKIAARFAEGSATSYEFEVIPLMETKAEDFGLLAKAIPTAAIEGPKQ